ncbi:hypothetical protein [Pseudomonas sp. GM48]|uniref:hypothetical protein n=1 Tax=Pseudomonas sp. GM48 TaxID=1144330 RepID=UPI00051940B4|nr:hypothetical protein [Pseudomonas sp. GM48]
MTADEDLVYREIARRKALWTLAHLISGDSRAAGIVDVLDEIDASLPEPVASAEKLFVSVPLTVLAARISIVCESAIFDSTPSGALLTVKSGLSSINQILT